MSWNQISFLEEIQIINEPVGHFGGLKYYMATGDLSNDNTKDLEKVNYENKPSRASLTAQIGDIIFARMKCTNKVLRVNEHERDYIFSTGFVVIRHSNNIDGQYLLHYLKSNLFQLEKDKLCTGATQKAINNQNLEKLKIPLPPLATQKRIAKILDAADSLRQKDQELLKKYDELAQAIFIDMFGNHVKNENDWVITDLKNIVHQDRIVTYGIVQAGKHIDDGIPYIKTGDIKNGEILINQLQKTSKEIAESYNRSKLYLNDIVMSIRATVGTVALLPDSLVGANLTQGTARISPSDKVNRLYLYYFLKNDFAQNWINENSKGATFREITLTKLRELPILLPPLKLQNQFGDIISNLLQNNSLLKNQIEISSDFFQSLLQKTFNGELNS